MKKEIGLWISPYHKPEYLALSAEGVVPDRIDKAGVWSDAEESQYVQLLNAEHFPSLKGITAPVRFTAEIEIPREKGWYLVTGKVSSIIGTAYYNGEAFVVEKVGSTDYYNEQDFTWISSMKIPDEVLL